MTEPEAHAEAAAPRQAAQRRQFSKQELAEMELETTIFNKLGSYTALNAAVDLFYKKVLADPLLAPFFQGIPMQRLRYKQLLFMSFAFSGTSSYFGKTIGAAHRQLILKHGLNLTHFDAVAGHFVVTLTELGVASDLIDEAARVVMTTRPLFDPKVVFEEERAAYEAINAPLAQSLRTLQAEITGGEAAKGVELSGAVSSTRTQTQGGRGDRASSTGLRISAIAEIFAPQVLTRDRAQQFTALSRGRTANGAASQGDSRPQSANGAAPTSDTHPHTAEGVPAGHASRSVHSGSGSAPAGQEEVVCMSAPVTLPGGGEDRVSVPEIPTAATDARKERRAMLKEVLRSIGVVPFVPPEKSDEQPQPTTPPTTSPTIRTAPDSHTPHATHTVPTSSRSPRTSNSGVRKSSGGGATAAAAPRTSAAGSAILGVVRNSLNGKGIAPAVSTRSLVGHWLETIPQPATAAAAGASGAPEAAGASGGSASPPLTQPPSVGELSPPPTAPLGPPLTLADLRAMLPTVAATGGAAGARQSASPPRRVSSSSSSKSSDSSSSGVSFMDSDEDLYTMLGVGGKTASVVRRNAPSVRSRRSQRPLRNSSRLSQSTDRTSAGGASVASNLSTRLLRYTPTASMHTDAAPCSPLAAQTGSCGSNDWNTAATNGSVAPTCTLSVGVSGVGVSGMSGMSVGSFDRITSSLATLEEVCEALSSHNSIQEGPESRAYRQKSQFGSFK